MGTGETRPDQDSQLPAEHAPGAPAQYFPTYIEPSPASVEIVVANSTQHIGKIRSVQIPNSRSTRRYFAHGTDQIISPHPDLDWSHTGQITSPFHDLDKIPTSWSIFFFSHIRYRSDRIPISWSTVDISYQIPVPLSNGRYFAHRTGTIPIPWPTVDISQIGHTMYPHFMIYSRSLAHRADHTPRSWSRSLTHREYHTPSSLSRSFADQTDHVSRIHDLDRSHIGQIRSSIHDLR